MNAAVEIMSRGRKIVTHSKEVYSVFEFHKTVGWRRATQAVWFFDKDYSESQLKVLQRVYPWREYGLRSSKECDSRRVVS